MRDPLTYSQPRVRLVGPGQTIAAAWREGRCQGPAVSVQAEKRQMLASGPW